MALHLQQVQRQTQKLIMTPQMQQSIQLLQLNAIELEQLAEQELTENPFLSLEEPGEEEGPVGEVDPEAASSAAEITEREADEDWDLHPAPGEGNNATLLETNSMGADSAVEGPATAADEFEAPALESTPEQFDQVDLNWDEYYSDQETSTFASTREAPTEERDFSEYVASRTSLYDEINWQLRCSSLEGIDAEIGEYLIGSLNEDGYLDEAVLAEAAEFFKVPLEQVERVLSIVQEFDPPGIAARNLPECLLIQMKVLGSYSDLARVVLEEHLIEFQKKKFRELSRKLNVDENALNELYKKVCRLEPHPGRSLTPDAVQYIQPDVYVKVIDGEMMIYLNEGPTSRLSVDRFYHRMIQQQAAAMNQQEKDYALEKYRSAVTLIKNIEKRKSTILRVTEAIMEVQRQFLDKGVEALRPLTLREIAEMVGMHESTVARVTSRKYVETPQGIFPLKYFFSSSIESQGNEAVSSRSIKDKLQQIIGGENPKKPYSDQRIAQMLNKQGFDIARRTVAKYREQLKILPAKYRRQT
jgi:RNA polymerase sigma-54 factor